MKLVRNLIQATPIVRDIAGAVYRLANPFKSSRQYWIDRYESGRNSGCGSFSELAHFKAEFLNEFVAHKQIDSVIEFGCGDGNQLRLATYPSYIGFDISPKALELCRAAFPDDASRSFRLMNTYQGELAELVLSLDVLYHLIEDKIFESYMKTVFSAATQFVIIYSSNTDLNKSSQAAHVRHRKFSQWVAQYQPEWTLEQHCANPHSGKFPSGHGVADFFVYRKA